MEENWCGVCFQSSSSLLLLECGCKVCENCLYGWSKSCCESKMLEEEVFVPCPYDTCKHLIKPDVFISYFSGFKLSQLQELLLRHYIVHTQDIAVCPMQGCSYAGIKIPLL